jgi:hypothetical protein
VKNEPRGTREVSIRGWRVRVSLREEPQTPPRPRACQKKKAGPPKRYTDREELVRAVREHCRVWLEENTGHPWPPEDYPSAADREDLEIEREAAKIFERLRKALLDALDFSSRTPPRSGHAAAFELRDLSAGVSRPRLEKGRVPAPLSDRTVFLLDWDHDRWLGRAPTNRELAQLSLFFGNFPTVNVNKKRPTANEIIALETNAIRAERTRTKRKRE